jgi:hypothetical protein
MPPNNNILQTKQCANKWVRVTGNVNKTCIFSVNKLLSLSHECDECEWIDRSSSYCFIFRKTPHIGALVHNDFKEWWDVHTHTDSNN